MPKLGRYRWILDAVFFAYPSEEAAREGRKAGATGFFVAVPSACAPNEFHHLYAVTNVHVVRHGARTIRLNRWDGGVDFVTPSGWVFRDDGPDVAVAPIDLSPRQHRVEAFNAESFLMSVPELTQREIGPGDDVFMVGRFVDHDSGDVNVPSLRFGHVSILSANVRQPETGYSGPSVVVDIHSRCGYSGSPVFVYRTAGAIFAGENTVIGGGHLLKLLGIHWGQFAERWELRGAPTASETGDEAVLLTDGLHVNGLSGMTCVAPGSDILRALDDPRLRAHREAAEAGMR